MGKKDGGQAFPKSGYGPVGNGSENGMSMRDYFAAKVICGLSGNSGVNGFDFEELARMSYVQADAMLAERAK